MKDSIEAITNSIVVKKEIWEKIDSYCKNTNIYSGNIICIKLYFK